jgi:peroxiredoxin
VKAILILATFMMAGLSQAEVEVGKPAPTFKEVDQSGKTHSLSDFKGEWVVLEWYNEGCPYVKKHYGSGNMQGIQKKYTAKGVKWLTVATSPEGKQGYVDPKTAAAHMKSAGMSSSALLLDPDGTMGRSYDAKTTPHMFIIDPKGTVVYAGAIDSNDSSDPDTIPSATNYVVDALDAALAGKPVKVASSKPYGCSVKYN